MSVSASHHPSAERSKRFDWRTIAVAIVMVAVVTSVYVPWSVIVREKFIIGSDHVQLHARRMKFAREHLFGPQRMLPHWYPRELMGTPYRANL